jgi:hypothetical protein
MCISVGLSRNQQSHCKEATNKESCDEANQYRFIRDPSEIQTKQTAKPDIASA